MPLLSETPATNSLAADEYRSLRATIRERGSLRFFVSAITFVAWATLAVVGTPGSLVTVLAPLVVLAGGFEVIFAIHVGVERIGRFIAVHHETLAQAPPAWERVAARLSPHPAAATGIDPLLVSVFAVATLANLLNVRWADLVGTESLFPWLLVLAAHIGFLLHLVRARRFASEQRERDEALFREVGL